MRRRTRRRRVLPMRPRGSALVTSLTLALAVTLVRAARTGAPDRRRRAGREREGDRQRAVAGQRRPHLRCRDGQRGHARRQAAAGIHERRSVPDDDHRRPHRAHRHQQQGRRRRPCSRTRAGGWLRRPHRSLPAAPPGLRPPQPDAAPAAHPGPARRSARCTAPLSRPTAVGCSSPAPTRVQILRLGDPARPTKGPTLARPGWTPRPSRPTAPVSYGIALGPRRAGHRAGVGHHPARHAAARHRARGRAAGSRPGLRTGRCPDLPGRCVAVRHRHHVPARLRRGGLRRGDRGREAPALRPRAGRRCPARRTARRPSRTSVSNNGRRLYATSRRTDDQDTPAGDRSSGSTTAC